MKNISVESPTNEEALEFGEGRIQCVTTFFEPDFREWLSSVRLDSGEEFPVELPLVQA